MYSIYHLVCPTTNTVRYVGQTKHSVEVRLLQHIKASRSPKRKYHVQFWIAKLLAVDALPLVVCAATGLSKEEANTFEVAEIARLKARGVDLCNLTSGGDTGMISAETKQRMSEARRGSKNHFYGKHHSNAAKKLISEKSGRPCSEERKRLLSKRFSGEKNPMFGVPSPLKGKHHTEHAKKLIADSKIKHWKFLSPEGLLVEFDNLAEFCKKHDLRIGHMHSVAYGKRNHHKGWRNYAISPSLGAEFKCQNSVL